MTKIAPEYWHEARAFLSEKDPVLSAVISSFPGESLKSTDNAFRTLANAIIGQQISVKAADAIWARLEKLADKIEPNIILKLNENDLKQVGLSRQKVVYMKHLSEFFTNQPDIHHHWRTKHDEEVIKDLVSIKGIGRWTAEMFLIFHLLRPDVFPLADLGLIKAINLHYKNKRELSRERAIKISDKWKPYRTVATWYLWRSLDPVPVQY